MSAGAGLRPSAAARPGTGGGRDERGCEPATHHRRAAWRVRSRRAAASIAAAAALGQAQGDARHRLCDFFTVCDCAGEYLYDMNQINLL